MAIKKVFKNIIMKRKNLLYRYLTMAGVMLIAMSCNFQQKAEVTTEKITEPEFNKAICVLQPTEGNNVTGVVTFTKNGADIHVVADLEGLAPGNHGFHIHEYGDCSKLDGTSAGGHFNPENKDHGGPMDENRHVGDLGNITADENGKAHLDINDSMIDFSGNHSIIGRAIIVHAGEDDLTSQPTGDAGARVAYGVIGIAK